MVSKKLSVELLYAVKAFLEDSGFLDPPLSIRPLAGDGSRRLFYRVHLPDNDFSCVVMQNPPNTDFLRRENSAYLRIAQHLHTKGLPVPDIYRFDLEKGWFIMEDVGDISLQSLASTVEDRVPLYKEVVLALFQFQTRGIVGFDRAWTCQTETYDRTVMRIQEAHYFRDAYLINYLGLKREWSFLESPFERLADLASKAGCDFLMHRDFQSRNIHLRQGKPTIIDWQGARAGPLSYDLASLLFDPYVGLSRNERDHIYEFYLDVLSQNHSDRIKDFEKYFPYVAIQRNLQILGAFSHLTLVEKKPHFEAYITPALNSLRELLADVKDDRLSPLRDLLESIPV
ncbi:MAG: phosphotransferase [Deltaproteobacteria bacterium]|nr:phosphotransferase [Deltaproteobacteria bacterium]MBW2139143.1 phosphotransferase [Deltaproteobacteria bacterium]